MKKKIVTSCLVVALLVVGIVGASLAYFTDQDNATNTFTVGNVDIDLIESNAVKDKTLPDDFTQGKTLMPGTQTDGNAVSKIVTVKNTGENDAYVWVDIKVPEALVSADFKTGHTDESKNALHWNSYGYFSGAYEDKYKTSPLNDGIINEKGEIQITGMVTDIEKYQWTDFTYVEQKDGYKDGYVVLRAKMAKTLPAGKTSLPALRQVYMDWRVTTGTDEQGNAIYNLPDGTTVPQAGTKWEVKVQAYAIQADGFETIDKAIAAFNDNGN